MAAPRSTSLRALRVLSQQHSATPCARRSLHITGVYSAQPANASDKASLYASRTLADLKSECQKRALRAAGTKSELIERLSNHDVLQSRAFSIAMRRINGNAFANKPTTRQFNTSRSQKAVKDTSTVDFVYMPSIVELDAPSPRAGPRIPILPDAYNQHDAIETAPSPGPMKPQIYTVAAGTDVSASPMSEVVDNDSVDIDPFTLTEVVGRSREGEALQRQNGSNETQSVVKELWTGMLDDLLGPKQQSPLRK